MYLLVLQGRIWGFLKWPLKELHLKLVTELNFISQILIHHVGTQAQNYYWSILFFLVDNVV